MYLMNSRGQLIMGDPRGFGEDLTIPYCRIPACY